MTEYIDIPKCYHCGMPHMQIGVEPNIGGETLKGSDILINDYKGVCPNTGEEIFMHRLTLSTEDQKILAYHGLTPDMAWDMVLEVVREMMDEKHGKGNWENRTC